jgi:PAS domain S-box-containing protein
VLSEGNVILANEAALQMVGLESLDEVDHELQEIVKRLDIHKTNNEHAITMERTAFFHALHGRRANQEVRVYHHGMEEQRILRMVAVPIRIDGETTGGVTICMDITEPRRTRAALRLAREQLEERVVARTAELTYTNALLQEQIEVREKTEGALRERNQELALLNMVTAATSSTLELPNILQTLRNLLRVELDIPGGAVLFYDKKQDRLSWQLHWGLPEEPTAWLEAFPVAGSRLEPVIRERASIHASRLDEIDFLDLDEVRPAWQSYLFVPLRAKGEVLGVICLFGRADTFDQAQLAFFKAVAQQVGMALYNARLYEEVLIRGERLQQLAQRIITAQEEERQRVSYELHDEAGQALTALMLSLEVTKSRLPAELEEARRGIADAIKLTGDTMEQIRLLAHDMRTPSLDTIGLNHTLKGLCQEFGARLELEVSYKGTDLPPLLDTVSISLYRAAQEALTNVAKHADADKVEMELHADKTVIRLSVVDDGKGFDPAAVFRNSRRYGIGLQGLQERLQMLGGQLQIDAVPGQGTRLVASVPYTLA